MKVLSKDERIEAAGGELVVVVQDEPGPVKKGMLHDLDVPHPVLYDADRGAYEAWGLPRASAAGTFLKPRLAVGYAKLMLGGERLRTRGSDPLQLGGDFVLDGDGVVTYAHPQESIDDRPPAGVLIRELERASGRAQAEQTRKR